MLTGVGLCTTLGQDMCSLVSPRHFRSLIIVFPLLGIMVFPASAQTGSDSNGTASVQPHSESTGGPISSGPATPKTGSNTSSQPQSDAGSKKAPSAILINIDKATQKMTVFVDGIQKYDWPVSTGRAGYSTPSGNYTATSMNEIWYSKQWDNSPMPHSIFFLKDGHAIHGSYEVKNLGKPVSHGCVRIAPENATTLYALVKANGLENTKVALTGVTPGGEFKFARSQRSPAWGFFEPSFGASYYNGPRGYYRWPSGYSRW